MQIITNEDGTEVEVFTAEELEAQKQEALEQYRLENPDKTGELELLQEELREARERLEKADDKSKNFANLRKAKEDAEAKIANITKEVDDKITLKQLKAPEGVTIIMDEDTEDSAVVVVHAQQEEVVVETPAEGAAPVEVPATEQKGDAKEAAE